MINKLVPKSEFNRNVITLMTGTVIAQAMPVAVSPILTRIYTPDEFGLFALYVAITSIVAVIATGRYELAIMLPKKNENAYQITILASIITLIVSTIILLLVTLFSAEIAYHLKNPDIEPWLFLLPLSILVTGLCQVFNCWHNRNKRYSNIAANRVLQSTGVAFSQLGLGFYQQSIGLIVGQLIGQVLSLNYLIGTYFKKDDKEKINILKTKALAKRYSQFPKIDVPTALINVAANQAPNILLASLFSTSSAGFYFLTQRVMQAPITLISRSVLDVYKQSATEEYQKHGHCRQIFKKTFWALLFMALPASVVLFLWVEDIFAVVFGEAWREAGVYAQILMPALFLRFIANPLSFMIYIAEKQLWNFYTMILLFGMILASLAFSTNVLQVIFWMAVSYCIYYLIHVGLSARLARGL